MKLIEIKNNLAKIYYSPSEENLHLCDFVNFDDDGKKLIAQVISSESTTRQGTNCAVVKFIFSYAQSNITAYDGFIPSLDSQISRTSAKTLEAIFGNKNENCFFIGRTVSDTNLDISLNKRLFNEFLYIQADRIENVKYSFKLLSQIQAPGIIFDTDGTLNLETKYKYKAGENFKLPINFETLNYIYDNDLEGLSVEQKAVVQDIVLEILDYIKSEKSGFIPFSTLMSVVDDIYESDKSVGIILFRNKLIKYNQANLFATDETEFKSIFEASSESLISLDLSELPVRWKKETLSFIMKNLKKPSALFLYAEDEVVDKTLITLIAQKANIHPVIASSYASEYAHLYKSFAKNLMLFSPEEPQKTYPVYGAFLSKLNDEEYVVTGKETYYAPLILSESPQQSIVDVSEPETEEEAEDLIDEKPEHEFEEHLSSLEEDDYLDNTEEAADTEIIDEPLILAPDEDEEEIEAASPIKNILEESIEAQIAKDVDGIFYTEGSTPQEKPGIEETEEISVEEVSDDELFSEEDLDVLDDLNEIVNETEDEILTEDEEQEELIEEPVIQTEETIDLDNISEETVTPEPPKEKKLEVKKAVVPNIPVYSTPLDGNLRPDETIKVAEGNIVYHEKYGRGVVEQIISYGKKTLCSIQFDNIGRRLLDPNLADLKQA